MARVGVVRALHPTLHFHFTEDADCNFFNQWFISQFIGRYLFTYLFTGCPTEVALSGNPFFMGAPYEKLKQKHVYSN